MRVIPSSIAMEYVETSTKKLKSFLKKLEGVVIVDSPPGLNKDSLSILKSCDEFLIITNPEMPAVVDAAKVIEKVRRGSDLDGDGTLDLVAANPASNSVSVLIGNADGTFNPKTDYTMSSNPDSVVAADLNGDGRLDLVTANRSDNSASVRLERHLEDDRETVAAFRAQIAAMADARVLADSTAMVWKARALTADAALEAREVECQLCLREVELLRQAGSPGLWARIRGNLNLAGVAGGVGLLIGLIIS